MSNQLVKIGDFVCCYIDYNFNGNIRYGELIKVAKNGICAIRTPTSVIYIDQKYVFKNKADLMDCVKGKKQSDELF